MILLLCKHKSIKFILLLTISIAVISKIPYANAQEKDIKYRPILKFSAGLVSAFSIHELSHALVAAMTDTDIHWEMGNYNQPIGFTECADSDLKGAALYSAGFFSSTVGSEIILQADKIDKNDPFVRGMMTWNILNPILYSLDYWFIRRTNKEKYNSYQGDFEGIEHYTNEPSAHGFAISLVAIAAFQGYRFIKTQSWAPDWLKGKPHNMYLEPMSSGGLRFTYKFPF